MQAFEGGHEVAPGIWKVGFTIEMAKAYCNLEQVGHFRSRSQGHGYEMAEFAFAVPGASFDQIGGDGLCGTPDLGLKPESFLRWKSLSRSVGWDQELVGLLEYSQFAMITAHGVGRRQQRTMD
ncbi:MAG TPA: hypothetical protein VJ505_00815 [Holophagaceae bacterium]|nr:hypothetical protein [Holophagaceae bacterium]